MRLLQILTADPLPAVPTSAGWRTQLGARLRALWVTKMFGTMLWILAFFAAYFWVLRNPMTVVTIMPLTPVDRFVQFRPEAIWLYASLWVYVSVAPALLKTFRELFSYGVATLGLSAAGLGVFIVWPTAVPAFAIDTSQHATVSLLKGVDLAGNACPSLHVAFAVFTAIWLGRVLREMRAGAPARALNWLWCIGIVYSTLATRQHVLLDVLAGAPLGACFALLHVRALLWMERGGARSPAAAVVSAGPTLKR